LSLYTLVYLSYVFIYIIYGFFFLSNGFKVNFRILSNTSLIFFKKKIEISNEHQADRLSDGV